MQLRASPREAIGAWALAKLREKGVFLPDFKAIGAFDGERIIGAVIYDAITPHDCDMHIVLAEKRAVTRSSIRAIFAYPFEQLKLARVSAQVALSNAASLSFVQRVGFEYEGTKLRGYGDEDQLMFGMTKEACAARGWLK